jgi:transcriptional regulator with XRE-family HTH domain
MSDAQARRRPSWGRLGTELRRLRTQAGLNRAAIGAAIGTSAETVTRIELGGAHGGSPPSVQRVLDWARACEVAGPDEAALRVLAEAALDEHRPYRAWGSLAEVQAGIQADEAAAMTLRNFNPWGIPGLLQSPGYARAVLEIAGRPGTDEAVAVRMARQAILGDPRRTFEFLVTGEGLRRYPGTVTAQRLQLAHLADTMARPSVTVGVIGPDAWLPITPPLGFVLYEDRAEGGTPFVAVELPHERVEASTPADVDFYRARFAELRELATFGDEARALITAATEALR